MRRNNSGKVRIAIATALARSVVRYPYLASRASMMKGMTAPVRPDDAEMSPKAIPFRTTHHSLTMLTIGYETVTNPRPYRKPWVAMRPFTDDVKDAHRSPRMDRGQPAQICWRWYFGNFFVARADSGPPR